MKPQVQTPVLTKKTKNPVFREKKNLENRKRKKNSQAPVAYAYNPSYLEGRDWEDHSSRPAWADSS
jgi:hypothetical protein